jgi:hypothetical protein
MVSYNREVPERVAQFLKDGLLIADNGSGIALPFLNLTEQTANFADKSENRQIEPISLIAGTIAPRC